MAYFYGFECRKWTVIVMCIYFIVSRVLGIITILSVTSDAKDDKANGRFNIQWYGFQLIKCAVSLVGLYGAIKEHLWFSLTFCLFFLYTGIREIIANSKLLYLLSIILTFLLLIDISFVIDLFRHYYSSSSSTKISIRTTISGKDSGKDSVKNSVKNDKFSKKTSTKNSGASSAPSSAQD